MIVQLTASYKFVCDRCGKESFAVEGQRFSQVSTVCFTDGQQDKRGDVCDNCLADFLQIAENFFDEVNRRTRHEGEL